MRNTITRNAIFYSIAFGVFLFAGAGSAAAQTGKLSPSSEAEAYKAEQKNNVQPAAPGTYQYLAKDGKSYEVFPVDILLEIEKNRDQKKVVYLNAGKTTVIKILPYRQITAKNFVPVPEYGILD